MNGWKSIQSRCYSYSGSLRTSSQLSYREDRLGEDPIHGHGATEPSPTGLGPYERRPDSFHSHQGEMSRITQSLGLPGQLSPQALAGDGIYHARHVSPRETLVRIRESAPPSRNCPRLEMPFANVPKRFANIPVLSGHSAIQSRAHSCLNPVTLRLFPGKSALAWRALYAHA